MIIYTFLDIKNIIIEFQMKKIIFNAKNIESPKNWSAIHLHYITLHLHYIKH